MKISWNSGGSPGTTWRLISLICGLNTTGLIWLAVTPQGLRYYFLPIIWSIYWRYHGIFCISRRCPNNKPLPHFNIKYAVCRPRTHGSFLFFFIESGIDETRCPMYPGFYTLILYSVIIILRVSEASWIAWRLEWEDMIYAYHNQREPDKW